MLNITKILQGTPTWFMALYSYNPLNITKILQGTPTHNFELWSK